LHVVGIAVENQTSSARERCVRHGITTPREPNIPAKRLNWNIQTTTAVFPFIIPQTTYVEQPVSNDFTRQE
jgi:hypothetical protein